MNRAYLKRIESTNLDPRGIIHTNTADTLINIELNINLIFFFSYGGMSY
jgi:hypothetical protein